MVNKNSKSEILNTKQKENKKNNPFVKLKFYILIFVSKFKFVISNLPKYIKRLFYYLGIWWMMSKNSFLGFITKKSVFVIFLVGKLLRLVFFLIFIFFIVRGGTNVAGYKIEEAIFFYLSFTLIDAVAQFIFREVYRFRPLVISGDLDLIMVKPYKTLFRVLMGGADIADLVTIPFIIAGLVYVGSFINPSVVNIISYIFLLFNSLIIAASFHILVLAMGIITLEVDHTVMIYRDLSKLAILPTDIYKEPLRGIITFAIPIGLMFTYPVKVFLGILSFKWVLISIIVAIILLVLSIKFWNFALRRYTSASS